MADSIVRCRYSMKEADSLKSISQASMTSYSYFDGLKDAPFNSFQPSGLFAQQAQESPTLQAAAVD